MVSVFKSIFMGCKYMALLENKGDAPFFPYLYPPKSLAYDAEQINRDFINSVIKYESKNGS